MDDAVQQPTGDAAFLTGGGETGALLRAHDWLASPLAPPLGWPQPLKTLVGVMLVANQPMFLAWGPERTLLYNDAYAEILASKHPAALGRDFLDVWSEVRADLQPIVEQAYAGRPVHMDDIGLVMHRRGYPEEAHFAFSYTPVRDEAGAVAGFFCPCVEITQQVLVERRRAFRLALEERLRDLTDPVETIGAASEALGRHLGASQVMYAEAEPGDEHVTIAHEWNDGTMAGNAGRHRLSDYGPAFIRALRRGEAVAIEDVRLDPRTSSTDALAAFARASVVGLLDVPLIKAGRLVLILGVHSAAPRAWSAEEVALAQEVAERIWDAVERARAEARLRESEARYRTLFAAAERRAAELRAVLESMPDAVYIGGEEGIALANQPALDQLGFATREELNRHVATLADEIQTRDAETGGFIAFEEQAFTRALGGERVVQDVRLRHRLSGEERIVRCAAAPVVIDGEVIAAVAVNTDVTEARRAEARLRALLETAPALIFATDEAGRNCFVNERYQRYTGLSFDALCGDGWHAVVHPDDRPAALADSLDARTRPRPIERRTRIRRHDGEWRWFLSRAEPVTSADGDAAFRWLGVSIDIDEQVRAEERERLLVREVDHRAKNLLAVVQSVVQLTRADDADALKEAVNGRIQALARSHGLLAASKWKGVDLRALVDDELAAFAGRGADTLRVEGPAIRLKPATAQSLGLVLHELATNAAKHGSLSVPSGRLEVIWALAADTLGQRRLELQWLESGGPEVAAPTRRGFGSTVIRTSVEHQLKGRAVMDWRPDGLACHILVPAEQLVAAKAQERGVGGASEPARPKVPCLAGNTVLVVEDEALIALQIEDALAQAGCAVVGPASTVSDAVDLLVATTPAAAILDVNLGGERSFPIADVLLAKSIPFAFCTGYAGVADLPERFRGSAVLAKPLDQTVLVRTLGRLVSSSP